MVLIVGLKSAPLFLWTNCLKLLFYTNNRVILVLFRCCLILAVAGSICQGTRQRTYALLTTGDSTRVACQLAARREEVSVEPTAVVLVYVLRQP